MVGHILGLDLHTYTFDEANCTPSTDAVRFPFSNLQDRVHPLRVYQNGGDGTTTTTITLIPTTGATVSAIFVDNINVIGSIEFTSEASNHATVDSFGSNTITKDSFSDRYKIFKKLATPRYFDGSTRKYIKMTISGTGLVEEDAVGKVQIGSITLITTAKELYYPGGYINGIEYERVDPVETTNFDGGGVEYTEIGSAYAKIAVPTRIFLEDSQLNDFIRILENKTKPIIFYENNLNISRAYTCKLNLSSGTKLSYNVNGKAFEGQISLIECV